MKRPRAGAASPAVRAEPRSVGTGRARDPLALEVRLLGALLGQVIAEQEGAAALDLVERVRRRTIALRRAPDPHLRAALDADLAALDSGRIAVLARAFSTYFQLVNLAEEKDRVRSLRRRARAGNRGPIDDTFGEVIARLAAEGAAAEELEAAFRGLRIAPVLTAHPTEARRRTVLLALRRIYGLLDALDDRRLTPDDDMTLRRRLREEITILWRTADLRQARPTPIDEIRTAMVFFDATIFTATPQLYRAADAALDLVGGASAGSLPFAAELRRRTAASSRRTRAGCRSRPERDPAAAGAGVPALGQLDRQRPRRPPVRHGRDHGRGPAHLRRPPAARVRGGRRAPDEHDLGPPGAWLRPAAGDRQAPRP